jgi:hypothetical protein
VKDAAGSLLDHLMDMNNPSEPRMPRVEDLKLLDLMGVISSLCNVAIACNERRLWVQLSRLGLRMPPHCIPRDAEALRHGGVAAAADVRLIV